METIFNIIWLLIIVGFFVWVIKKQRKNYTSEAPAPVEYLPYSKKQYLMSRTENEFFKILEKAVSGQYYIFPQVNLDKIVYADGQHSYRNPYYNKIDRKSVDYVLFDKNNISPKLVIELDDYTHQGAERKERDGFVDRVLARCGIPILHVKSLLPEEELRSQISSKLTPSHGTPI